MRKILLLLIFISGLSETVKAVKIIYGPYLQMIGETEASIVWVTDKKSLSWVEIAPDDGMNFYAEQRPQFFETFLGRKVLGTVHKIKLTGLTKGTTYRYRIFSQEVMEEQDYQIFYGPIASTNVYTKAPLTFRTLDSSQEKVRFFMVNDIHGNNDLFNSLLKEVKKGETDFVLFNGDMVSHMDSEQQLFEGFVTSAVKKFASEIPFYMVRGNHESRGRFAQNYLKYFPTPTGMPYYTFKQGPVFFIIMDGGEDKPDNDIEYLGTGAFDAYREEEAAWLQQVVASQEFKTAPFKVVVIHVPPTQSTWHGPLHTKKMFVPILNKAGIDLMLCGHLHQHIYAEPGT
ncbi:MAG TPA: metallophosphoesterase, partial [Candidatus Gallibacteroides avistercoris]|nr:metallophosphoesterase [Candidatus Gallibacteroides avistercoris]